MDPLVTIIVITRNHGEYLKGCLQCLLGQSYNNYEILVVDDESTDNTPEVVNSFPDGNIRYFRNDKRLNVALSRNFGIEKSAGKFIFFTDADCLPNRHWVAEGMRCFDDSNVIGVEGITLPEHQNVGAEYHFVENVTGGQYQTCNVAYRRNVLQKIGGFNSKFEYAYEDVELAIRAMKEGTVPFCKDMLVFHRLVRWTWKRLYENALWGRYKVLLVKEHHYRKILTAGILEINLLLQVTVPFLLPLYYRIKTPQDILILPLFWVRSVLHRLIVWKTAIEEKVFIL